MDSNQSETQTPIVNPPVEEKAFESILNEQPEKKKSNVFTIIVGILLFLILCMGGYYVYTQYIAPKEEVEQEQENENEFQTSMIFDQADAPFTFQYPRGVEVNHYAVVKGEEYKDLEREYTYTDTSNGNNEEITEDIPLISFKPEYGDGGVVVVKFNNSNYLQINYQKYQAEDYNLCGGETTPLDYTAKEINITGFINGFKFLRPSIETGSLRFPQGETSGDSFPVAQMVRPLLNDVNEFGAYEYAPFCIVDVDRGYVFDIWYVSENYTWEIFDGTEKYADYIDKEILNKMDVLVSSIRYR